MSILKVARMGHPVLRTRARALDVGEVRSAMFQTLIDDMIATMIEYEGIGLAGPQVHEGVRLFVAGMESGHEKMRVVPFINPVITPVGEETVDGWEGCLSIPDIRGKVPRFKHVVVKALDRRGQPFELDLSDFPARVVQHETDHLDGTLFFDRIKDFRSLTYLEEYGRYHAEREEE
ncbi:MAG: peptide deformylase [Luteitalea sp.]|nr:peptide deformylase [Luteitalea sp.]